MKTTLAYLNSLIIASIILALLFALPAKSSSIEASKGKVLFENHCSACHINGGNIIRRNKNLKLKALKKNGLDDPELIAIVASKGIGIMSGYQEVLGDEGDKLVADWIWEQAQKAWIQG